MRQIAGPRKFIFWMGLDCSITKDILFEALLAFDALDLKIVSVTCDQARTSIDMGGTLNFDYYHLGGLIIEMN